MTTEIDSRKARAFDWLSSHSLSHGYIFSCERRYRFCIRNQYGELISNNEDALQAVESAIAEEIADGVAEGRKRLDDAEQPFHPVSTRELAEKHRLSKVEVKP